MKKRMYGKHAVKATPPSLQQECKIRWGLFAVTIGCIMIMYASMYSDIVWKLRACISGAILVSGGAWLVYKGKKEKQT